MTSVLSYWDLYVAYIDKCVRDNQANDIDPHHYEMEWNHTLPQCLFGDWPIGQYLTLRQHSIASALQTLAFKKNCMFGWHKKDLPDILVELAWPYYTKQCADNGRKNAAANFTPELCIENGKKNAGAMNDHDNTVAVRSGNGRKAAAANFTPEVCIENGKKTGPANARALSDHANTKKYIEKISKQILLTNIATGETFEFPSLQEACRVLGLKPGNLCKVIGGERNQHKGYTAAYI